VSCRAERSFLVLGQVLLSVLSTQPRGCPALRDRHAPTEQGAHGTTPLGAISCGPDRREHRLPYYAPCARPLGVIIAANATAGSSDSEPCTIPKSSYIRCLPPRDHWKVWWLCTRPCGAMFALCVRDRRELLAVHETAGSYAPEPCTKPLVVISRDRDRQELWLHAVHETAGSYVYALYETAGSYHRCVRYSYWGATILSLVGDRWDLLAVCVRDRWDIRFWVIELNWAFLV